MKKYILTAVMVVHAHQFFAASQQFSLIDRQILFIDGKMQKL